MSPTEPVDPCGERWVHSSWACDGGMGWDNVGAGSEGGNRGNGLRDVGNL